MSLYDDFYWEGYSNCMQEFCERMGFTYRHQRPEDFFSYLKQIEQQAKAFQSMEHILDKNMEPLIAANRLAREIEKYRNGT